jgi:hypothetical protein
MCPQCRMALPQGSRFCNHCGAVLGGQPGAERTQAMPQQPPYDPSQRTQQLHQQPYNPAAGQPYNPAAGAAYAAPVATGGGRPWWILAILLLVVAGAVTTGVVALARRGQPSVVAGQQPQAPIGPGVAQNTNPGMPAAPGVTQNPVGQPPPPGSPVTGAPKNPDSDMAPGITMGPGSGTPTAPSVVAGRQVPLPPGPAVTGAPTSAPPPAAPVVSGQPQAPPAPRDNSDFDRYLRWMQYVENERRNLRSVGETQAFSLMEGYLNTLLSLSDPDANETITAQQMEQRTAAMFQRTLAAIQAFQQNIVRTRPPVPSDCRTLDNLYLAAAQREGQATAQLVAAMSRRDIGTIKTIGRQAVGDINSKLGQANLELERVYKGRGLNQLFKIDAGGGSSMLDGISGLGGLGLK